jgi:protein-S-isoprenylcysteine O-methyltransferase Ste14
MVDDKGTKAPVNQKLRIAVLRIVFVLCLPLIVFSRPVWIDHLWLFEPMEVVGIILTVIAVLGRFWAVLYIGGRKNSHVFQDGPYSIMRHPLYTFSTIGVAGFGLMLGSLVLTVVLTLVFFAILSVTASKEEGYLRAQFDKSYEDYAARVPRLVPKLALFKTSSEVTFCVASLRGNTQDAFVFLGLIPIANLLVAAKSKDLWPTFVFF